MGLALEIKPKKEGMNEFALHFVIGSGRPPRTRGLHWS